VEHVGFLAGTMERYGPHLGIDNPDQLDTAADKLSDAVQACSPSVTGGEDFHVEGRNPIRIFRVEVVQPASFEKEHDVRSTNGIRSLADANARIVATSVASSPLEEVHVEEVDDHT